MDYHYLLWWYLCAERTTLQLRKKTEFKRNNIKTLYSRSETLTFLRAWIWKIAHTKKAVAYTKKDYAKKAAALSTLKWK